MAQRKSKQPKNCFVIAPIGGQGTPTRKATEQVMRYLIAPALDRVGGYAKPLRADQLGEPGIITRQIIDHVINDSLVIADLRELNPNVFYELAVRHAFRKPVVQLLDAGTELPFDVKDMRTVFYDLRDLDAVEEAKDELTKHLKAIDLSSDQTETPISRAVELQELKTGTPTEKALAQIQTELAELRAEIRPRNRVLASSGLTFDASNIIPSTSVFLSGVTPNNSAQWINPGTTLYNMGTPIFTTEGGVTLPENDQPEPAEENGETPRKEHDAGG